MNWFIYKLVKGQGFSFDRYYSISKLRQQWVTPLSMNAINNYTINSMLLSIHVICKRYDSWTERRFITVQFDF